MESSEETLYQTALINYICDNFETSIQNFTELIEKNKESKSLPQYILHRAIAKNEFPGARNNLDALCRRFNIDNSARTFHGALLDAQLLAEVYLQLLGGDEPSIKFVQSDNGRKNSAQIKTAKIEIKERHFTLSAQEEEAHRAFMEKNLKNPLWLEDEVKAENA